jgi:hypothetical protein
MDLIGLVGPHSLPEHGQMDCRKSPDVAGADTNQSGISDPSVFTCFVDIARVVALRD